MQEQKREKEIPSFLMTHKRNRKGKIVLVEPYRLHCVGQMELYEVPKGSGNWITYQGRKLEESELIRFGLDKFERIETPLTLDQKIAAKRAELAEIEAKIAAAGKGDAKEVAVGEAAATTPAAVSPGLKVKVEAPVKKESDPKSAFASQVKAHVEKRKAGEAVEGSEA